MNVIQIGANRGNDDLTEILLKNLNELEKVILVEPITLHHGKLEKCYKNIPIVIEGIAITDNNRLSNMNLYYSPKDAPNYEVTSFSKEHLKKHGFKEEEIIEQTVPCMTINKLMEKHQLIHLDILFIDAEGLDERIIKSIDFKNFKLQKIVYENIHLNSNENLIHYLSRKGYYIKRKTGHNGWSNEASISKPSVRFFYYQLRNELSFFYRTFKLILNKSTRKALKKVRLFESLKAVKASFLKVFNKTTQK